MNKPMTSRDVPVSNRTGTAHGYARPIPWQEAIREVPSTWLEDEARRSPSPHSLLATWKGDRGVPSHVMLKLLRRRLREHHSEMMKAPLPPARLQRTQDMLGEIWARVSGTGAKHPTWRLVEALLRMARDHLEPGRARPDREPPHHDRAQ
jgi:hypothetical protein